MLPPVGFIGALSQGCCSRQTCSPLLCPLPAAPDPHACINPACFSFPLADKPLVCVLGFFGGICSCADMSVWHLSEESMSLQSDELAHVFCRPPPRDVPPTHSPRAIKHRNGSPTSELVPTPARGTTLLPAPIWWPSAPTRPVRNQTVAVSV